MIAVGPERFGEFLTGAHEMDQHFLHAPLPENMPVLLGLVGVWHRNVMRLPDPRGAALRPAAAAAARLPAAARHGSRTASASPSTARPVTTATGPVVWGEPGTNGQHAFYQLIHQGTDVIPCEFMVAADGHEPALEHHHELLLANCLAQSEALMRGRNLAEAETTVKDPALAPHKVFPGNRPSTTLDLHRARPARPSAGSSRSTSTGCSSRG